MKKKISKIVLVLIVGLFFSPLTILYADVDYASNESHYNRICSDPVLSKENRQVCMGYNEYLREKASKAEEEIEKLDFNVNEIKASIETYVKEIKTYEKNIEEQQKQIVELENGIQQLKVSIVDLESSIVKRENEIKEKDEVIVERMKKDQSDIHFGNEIDFLMGSEDFATLISSISILKDILNYEDQQIKEIERIIEVQNEEKETLKMQQETLNISAENAKIMKAKNEKEKEKVEAVVTEFKIQEANLLQQKARNAENIGAIQASMQNISEALKHVETSSGGFRRPIDGGFISATVWQYPGGGTHLGVDYAAPVGTPIYAAGNGVVLSSANSCPTMGYLGNWCGSPGLAGGGNQVILVVSIDNKIYQISYYHMQSGSPIAMGTMVSQGQQIGRLGSSGNSSGPHVHTEIIYLGTGTINDYVLGWNGDFSRGLGYYSSGTACEYNGYAAPCRLNPGEVWGS